MVQFGIYFFGGCAGWFVAGYGLLASNRVENLNPIWQKVLVRAFGFAAAVSVAIAASTFGSWWWGLLIYFISPLVTLAICMILLPPVQNHLIH